MTRPDGLFVGMDADDIALDAGWSGDPQKFVDALVEVGFLDPLDGGLYGLHDWDDHNSYASAVDDRSDKARFTRLRQVYPELYAKLFATGVRAISREEYQRAVDGYLSGVGDAGESQRQSPGNPTATPEPSSGDATATPRQTHGDAGDAAGVAPAPSPSPKKEHTLCDPPQPQKGKSGSAPRGAARARPGMDAFKRFWDAFADKRGREAAWKAWCRIKGLDDALVEQIVAGAVRYAAQRAAIVERGGTPKMAEGWLTGRRWEDEVVGTPGSAVSPDLQKAFEKVLGGASHEQQTAA
jgi:hypothetical protein